MIHTEPLLLSTAHGIDVLFPTPHRCRCGEETQVFHNIEGRTACAGCERNKLVLTKQGGLL